MAGKRIVVLSLFVLVALTLGLFASSGTEAGTYKVRNNFYILNPVAGQASSNDLYVTIPAPDYNYEDSSMYNLGPVDGWVTQSVALPLGARVGILKSTAYLGLFNGKCTESVDSEYPLYNSSVDTSVVLTRDEMAWTNTTKPVPVGTYLPYLPDYVVRYPTFINSILDPDGPCGPQPPLKPRARYAGDGNVAGSWMLIQVIILNPGQIAQLPGIKSKMAPQFGSVLITALNNPYDQEEQLSSSVSDFCSPMFSFTTLYGNTWDNTYTGWINDGCPIVNVTAESGAACNNNKDDDGDTKVNDGCPVRGSDDDKTDAAETTLGRKVNDGCPAIVPAETGSACNNDLDDDGDTTANDGCAKVGDIAESGTQCNQDPEPAQNTLWCNTPIDEDGDPNPDESGYLSQANAVAPAGVLNTGTYIQRNYSMAERDADGDGWENDLDPCPYSLDDDWDPRIVCTAPGGYMDDNDCDGIPNSCDPTPDEDVLLGDQDNDGYPNRKDICPSIANGGAPSVPWDNQLDTDSTITANADLGPQPDSIGDACDDSDDDGNEDGCGAGTCNDGKDNGVGVCDGSGADGADALDSDCTPYMDRAELGWCRNNVDDDADTRVNDGCVKKASDDDTADAAETTAGRRVNDGCPAVGTSESATAGWCSNDLDDDGDTTTNDGCLKVGGTAESGAQCIDPEDASCADALDENTQTPNDEGDAAPDKVNDGCPAKGDPETLCDNNLDDDADTNVNDGCPAIGKAENPACVDALDSDADTRVNDGCPLKGADPELPGNPDDNAIWGTNPGTGSVFHSMPWSATCVGGTDTDKDGYCNDLETQLGSSTTNGSEANVTAAGCSPTTTSCCLNNTDDDVPLDGYVNDGCPVAGTYSETGAECAIGDNDSDDTAGVGGLPDTVENDLGAVVNDGCPVIGVPESLVIDALMNAPGALPSANVPQSCSDGLDNDGDTTTDTDATALGCTTGTYTGDADYDGVPDASDNCGGPGALLVWNPEQTNTDVDLNAAGAQYPLGTPVLGDGLGDACDSDDDNDTYPDTFEWYMGTDPLDNCSNSPNDAFGPDINKDKSLTVVGDVSQYSGKIGNKVLLSPPTSWGLARLDLNKDNAITVVGDVSLYSGKIGNKCL